MATVSLSPSPVALKAMSSRRGPLTSNPNIANSPLRAGLNGLAKTKRSHATVQREEAYGQPPPSKRQALDPAASQRVARSPSKLSRSTVATSTTTTQRASRLPTKTSSTTTTTTTQASGRRNVESEREAWKRYHRQRFPQMIFYFESVPDELRAKLTKKITYLGARQEPFFSNEITHIVTARSIPNETTANQNIEEQQHHDGTGEQPTTINPSLLDKNASAARRKLLSDFKNAPARSHHTEGGFKLAKIGQKNDVLVKAKDMGKKIWPLEKFQDILKVLLENEMAEANNGSTRSRQHHAKGAEGNLHQLLNAERLNGPSDRDPSAISRDLVFFKGPHIYVWDMDEKQKPMMARDYPKVANKADGDWPQFRSVGNGRCPFVEEPPEAYDQERRREREARARAAKRAAAAAANANAPGLKAAEPAAPAPITGKRSLTEMEDGNNQQRNVSGTEVINSAKATLSKQSEPPRQAARLFRGEPIASGIQPSAITSAIRSQMISSTSGLNGAKAGTSKEVHGLQRKVLQKVAPDSRDPSSRRFTELSMDVASSRSNATTTLSRATSKAALGQDEEGANAAAAAKKAASQPLKSKKDLKPGYCENCQDKFRDFDEHILSRKHRKFAENLNNWTELDALLSQLTRNPKYPSFDEEDHDMWLNGNE